MSHVRGENPRYNLLWWYLTMVALSHLLVEGIVWTVDLLQGENLGLTLLVKPDDDGVSALFPPLRHYFWRSYIRIMMSPWLVVLLLLRGFGYGGGVFSFFLSLFSLSPSAVCTLVVQRPGVDSTVCIPLMYSV